MMRAMKQVLFAIGGIAVLAGCAPTVPTTITQHPTSSRPQAAVPAQASNGAIFQAGAYRPMFEDHRARHVGDTLTVRITENSNIKTESANASSKSGSANASVDRLFGVSDSVVGRLGVGAANSRQFADKDTASSGNNFTSTLTATVVEVLPNGNLVVSGEKQVGLDKSVEYIRFSGVVNPSNISSANTVNSTQIADVRAEYRTSTQVDTAQFLSALTRFFLSVLPL